MPEFWNVVFRDGVSRSDASAMRSILLNPRGWATIGVRFGFGPAARGDEGRTITIRILPREEMRRRFPSQFHGYSVCDMRTREVFIDEPNWRLGSELSGMDLEHYRMYIVTHEVGHALGFRHASCEGPGALASVMQQHTFGTGECLPNPFVDGRVGNAKREPL